MAYKRPSDERVEQALRRVLVERGTVHSQTTLTELVRFELQKQDADYTVGPARLRRIAVKARFARLDIHARRADERQARTRCPVCRAPLARVRNRTLFNGEVTLAFQCSKCPYWTGQKRRVPTRYVFELRHWKFK